mmetsp:Transcript_4834/g.14646  ORF Transcript_4834/g.14646 Transcript_4834/m.14646 type:complete len:213 (+) Transcript_4834:501-1139(+)
MGASRSAGGAASAMAARKARMGSAWSALGRRPKFAKTEATLSGVRSAWASWARACLNCGVRATLRSSSRVCCDSGRWARSLATMASSSKTPEESRASAETTSESESGGGESAPATARCRASVERACAGGRPRFCITLWRPSSVIGEPAGSSPPSLVPSRRSAPSSEVAGAGAAASPFIAAFSRATTRSSSAPSFACIQKKKRRDAFWPNWST